MNQHPGQPAPEDESQTLFDPNMEDDEQVFAEGEPVEQPIGDERKQPASAATPAPDPAELTRQNEFLKQRVAQEAQARQQLAAQQVQQWYNSLPDDKKMTALQQIQAARFQGEAAQREEEDKGRVMWTLATQVHKLEGQYLQEFYTVAKSMTDPEAMERLAARYKHFQELEKGGGGAQKARPAMANVRPDGGAPEGNRTGSLRKRQEEILAPYMGGGPKQGKLEELELELMRHGKYGRNG